MEKDKKKEKKKKKKKRQTRRKTQACALGAYIFFSMFKIMRSCRHNLGHRVLCTECSIISVLSAVLFYQVSFR